MGIIQAERARARTLWPAARAAFTVSRPMPRLAPIMRSLAMFFLVIFVFDPMLASRALAESAGWPSGSRLGHSMT